MLGDCRVRLTGTASLDHRGNHRNMDPRWGHPGYYPSWFDETLAHSRPGLPNIIPSSSSALIRIREATSGPVGRPTSARSSSVAGKLGSAPPQRIVTVVEGETASSDLPRRSRYGAGRRRTMVTESYRFDAGWSVPSASIGKSAPVQKVGSGSTVRRGRPDREPARSTGTARRRPRRVRARRRESSCAPTLRSEGFDPRSASTRRRRLVLAGTTSRSSVVVAADAGSAPRRARASPRPNTGIAGPAPDARRGDADGRLPPRGSFGPDGAADRRRTGRRFVHGTFR